MRSLRLLSLAVVLLLAGVVPAEPAPSVARLNRKIDDFTLCDAQGKPLTLHGLKDRKAIVVVFLSFECPVSNGYAPTLAELARTYGPRGVAFLGVNSSDDLTAAQVERQAREFGLPFPVRADRDRAAADALKAVVSPEAFVLDHHFVLRYRGRIDNTYAARLRKNQQTTSFELRQALDDVLAGRPVATPATRAVGCPVDRVRPGRTDGKVTYHRDVLPILQAHCQQCHRPGESGPFALLTYDQAVSWATDLKEYTQDRRMPPWKPVEGLTFHNERRLSNKEIATLAAWVDGGTPEGDPRDAPPARKFSEGWQLGEPDLVLTVPEEMTVGAGGRDLFRCFVLPTNLSEDRFVTAIEVRPGNKRVVHHTLNFLDRSGAGRRLERQEKERDKKAGEPDHGPGYSVAMGVGFLPQGGLGGWAPGQRARELPAGTGYRLPKGSDVVVQVHYHRTGRVEKDRLRIGLYFARKPVQQVFQGMVIPGRFLAIPAGNERFRVKGGIEVLQDCILHSVMPHMHMLGRQIRVTLTPPGGTPTTLLAIRDWDYNWQETYFLEKPLAVRAGTRLEVEAFYDNSVKNPSNPFNPPRLVFFGEQTTNEMCFVFLGATSDTPGRIRFRRDGQPARLRPAERDAGAPARKP